MKKTLLALSAVIAVGILLLATLSPRASDFTPAEISRTSSATLLAVTTNGTGSATWVEISKHHTFQITSTVISSNANVYLDRSLNGTHWVPFSTNFLEFALTNDTTLVGHWSYVRARLSGVTNTIAVTVLYLGGN